MAYQNKERRRWQISAALVSAAMVMLTIFLAGVAFTPGAQINQVRENSDMVSVQSPHRQEVYAPDAPAGIVTEYRIRLADVLENDPYLAFYTVHQETEVYLDEELIYSLTRPAEIKNAAIGPIGCHYVMVPLLQEDGGKEILVRLTPAYKSARSRDMEFVVGSARGIFMNQLAEDFTVLLLSVVLIFCGVFFFCAAISLLIIKKRGKSVLMHGFAATTLGLCRMADTRFAAMVFPSATALLGYLSITMLLVYTIALFKSVKIHLSMESRERLDRLCLVFLGNCVLQLALQWAGIVDLRQLLPLTYFLNFIGGILLLLIVIRDIRTAGEKGIYRLGKWMCLMMGMGVLLDTYTFYVTDSSSRLIVTMMVLLLYIILTGISLGARFFENEIQAAQNRLAAMVCQIRSHFVFNILNAISGMCKYDPAAADRTVVLFARYLRSNMDMLESVDSVPFRTALRHLEDYVALEQVRFGDRIEFVTDIRAEHFLLPPLMMQPVVENAIKHGLMPKPEGGTICLRTWQEGKLAYIEITDNGVGFDPQTVRTEKTVGLKNVRFRIQQMPGGKLEIESIPGKGTKVTIVIPCKEVK